MIECEYVNCENTFEYRSNKKYCCRMCKQKAKKLREQKIRDNNIINNKILGRPYLKYKKEYCEFCGFIAIHKCQLDVDHIDGNHYNNDPDNLQTLCANCHRLKTRINNDYKKIKYDNNK